MAEKKVAWPSVEQQLAAYPIRPGSALEKLVRENQDFHMLRPEEAHDDRDIPLWLRVYWRKHHPEWPIRPGDPAGYPEALETMLLIMLGNQDNPEATAPPPPPAPHQKKHGGHR